MQHVVIYSTMSRAKKCSVFTFFIWVPNKNIPYQYSNFVSRARFLVPPKILTGRFPRVAIAHQVTTSPKNGIKQDTMRQVGRPLKSIENNGYLVPGGDQACVEPFLKRISCFENKQETQKGL